MFFMHAFRNDIFFTFNHAQTDREKQLEEWQSKYHALKFEKSTATASSGAAGVEGGIDLDTLKATNAALTQKCANLVSEIQTLQATATYVLYRLFFLLCT